jgi:glutathione S-transferase
MSPFAAKTEAWLKIARIPYELKPADPRRAPNGKVPYIRHDGQILGDSSRIEAHLTEAFDVQLDVGLTDAQRAVGHLLQRTLEESLYWVIVYLRWAEDEGFAHMKVELAKLIPALVFPLAWRLARKKSLSQLKGQGTALLGREGAIARGVADLDACAELLGDGPFLFGDAPTSYDAMLFAFFVGTLRSPNPHPLQAHAQGLSNLCAFVERMEAHFDAT